MSKEGKNLSVLLSGVEVVSVVGDQEVLVSSVSLDSNDVAKGSLFAALSGHVTDGHLFIDDVIHKGAKVIIYEHEIMEQKEGITYVKVTDSHEAIAIIASNFFGNPSTKFKLIGVTGTNGKTTIALLLYNLFTKLGYKCGIISTVGDKVAGNKAETLRTTPTTPDAVSLQKLFTEMVLASCSYVFMEVSSHAVAERRVSHVTFAGGIFTNLTHDHLDYHHTFENYRDSKKGFFDMLSESAFALTNIDDEFGQYVVESTKAKKYTYSLKSQADFTERLDTKLVGEFNAYNILAIYGTAVLLEQDKEKVKEVIKELDPAPGRFESYTSQSGVVGIVDYAHSPDSVQNVLKTIRNMCKGKIITVVGCGGDRDKTKRPLMAKFAYEASDITILTSDNPRSENPMDILNEMQNGVENSDSNKLYIIEDRRKAIEKASELAVAGDYVALLGKGHETYQEVAGIRNHFNDMEELKKYLK